MNTSIKILVDVDVIIDVLQKKTTNFPTSSELFSRVLTGDVIGYIPGIALSTIYRLVMKDQDRKQATDMVDWFIANFEITEVDKNLILDARNSNIADFEAAVVLQSALRKSCDYIVTRRTAMYTDANSTAITPEMLLYELTKK